MYQVIARKYRPQRFEDVVNQEHVKQTLINALTQGRVGHGYIFSGPRGTGKTTMARILAKALNCEKGMGATPCLECPSCVEVAAGNSMDLVEIDAASNRRIDDIRELRENVRYRPVRDRYKVFIIDEAHQITADAFNALLKTLEEPPEWVVFILCTTEPQQFPATIVSRCQSFPFRTVEMDDVVGRMQWICEQEKIEADQDALVAIALAGDGSIRDSLSTLDQAIASFGSKLEAGPVRDLLGAIPSEIAEQILVALRDGDPGKMLALVDSLAREGRHLQHFCGELTRHFRNLMVLKVSGADTRLVTTGPQERKRLASWAEQFSQEDLTRYLNLLVDLYRDMQNAPQPRFRLEVGLLKLVYAGRLQPIEKVLANWGSGNTGSSREPGAPRAQGGGGLATASTSAGEDPARPSQSASSRSEMPGRGSDPESANGMAAPVDPAAQQAESKTYGTPSYTPPGHAPDQPPAGPQAAAAAAVGAKAPQAATSPPPIDDPHAGMDEVPYPMPALSVGVTSDVANGPATENPIASTSPAPAPREDSQGAPQGPTKVKGDGSILRAQLAEALRTQGDDSLADAIEHGAIDAEAGRVEVRSLPDYRGVLELGMDMLQQAVAALLPGTARVTLGSDLAPSEAPQVASSAASAGPPSAPDQASGSSEAAQRALADPEVQKIQKLFTGQIREVRNLRGYAT